MNNNENKNKKTIIAIVGLVLLVVMVVGITYAAFTYTKKGQVENTVRTGKITMSYTEGENGITLNNAYPIADNVGKVMSDENQLFDFTVDINLYGNSLPVSYEITGEKDVNSTLADEDIRIYLEKASNGTNYTSVLEPSGYIPLTADDSFGAKTGEMVLEEGTTNDSVTFNYRLRMWVGESYKVTGEEKYFTMKVNVYGNDGVTVEVKGVELDQKSATLKLTNTLQLNAKTSPASPTDTSITWTSSNPFVATVSDTGLVEAKGIGNVLITATSSNGKSATSNINVTADCMTNNTADACIAGTPIAYKVNDTTTQNFYVLKDNGTTLDLITDKVVATGVAWNSSGNNSGGPVTATEALENATSSWPNVSSNTYNGAAGQATRARLITKAEAEAVGCTTTSNSCPNWLSDASSWYWTSSQYTNSSNAAYFVGAGRYLSTGRVNDSSVSNGIRAVVTVSK